MYLTSRDALRSALDERSGRRDEIRARVDAYINKRYGIEAYSDVLDRFFPFRSGNGSCAVLPRQIASMNVENMAFELGTAALGLSPMTLSFVRDAFATINHDKLHRLRIPWISWSKKGHMLTQYVRASSDSNAVLEGVPLDGIICEDGVTLPDYHHELRQKAGMCGPVGDVSRFHTYMLEQARNLPEFVYRINGRSEVRHVLGLDRAILERDRPPSFWYYPYYLSWFMDGTLVMFETYDNPLGGVAQAKDMFERVVRELYEGIGFLPLVVKIPPLSKDMLWCNRHFLEHGDDGTLAQAAARLPYGDTVQCFQSIAETVISFR